MHLSDLGELTVHIASFLNVLQISRCEEASSFFSSKEAAVFSLHEAAMEQVLSKVPVWGPSGHSVINQLIDGGVKGKHFLRELRLLRLAVFPPKTWNPDVVETSFCSAKVLPEKEEDHDENGTPLEVAIPLTIGSFVGQSLAVGMEVVIEPSETKVESAFCIGVEVCAGPHSGRSMSVLFAPYSGICYMQYRGDSCLLSTPVLSPLNEPCAGPLQAWVKIAEDGSMYFLRQTLEDGKVEASGILPRDTLPRWACEYFVCAHVWRAHLANPLDLRVVYSCINLPGELREYAPKTNVESTWSLHS